MVGGLIVGKSHCLVAVLFDLGLMLCRFDVVLVPRARLHVLSGELQAAEKKKRDESFHDLFFLRNWWTGPPDSCKASVSECSRCNFCPGAACWIRRCHSERTFLSVFSVCLRALMSAAIVPSFSCANSNTRRHGAAPESRACRTSASSARVNPIRSALCTTSTRSTAPAG